MTAPLSPDRAALLARLAEPRKFDIAIVGGGATGLGVALEYLMSLGMANISAHEASLRDYALERLGGLNWLQIQGTAPGKGAIFSMTMEGAHAHDIATILDQRGIAVRAGTHCAMPLMQHYGIPASARASFAMYNTREDVDALVSGLEFCRELFA